MKKCVENVKIEFSVQTTPMQTNFVKKDALYKVHTILTQSLFLKNYIMLISQFRSRFYLRKVITIIFVCMCMYMSVHVCTYYVFVCMCMFGAVASQCFMYEPDL